MGAAALQQLMEAVGQAVKAEREESRKEMREACESTVSAAVQKLTEAVGQTIKAEREESRKEMREACESTVSEAVQRLTESFGQTVKAEMEESRKDTKEAYDRTVSEAVQRLTEGFGQTVKTEMEESRQEVKEAFEKMACEAIQEVTAVVSEHKNKTDDAHARLTTDLKADWKLTAEAVESKQCSMAVELRGQMEDAMPRLADKLDALELSVQSPRPATPSLHAPEEGTRGTADRTDAPELSVQSPTPDMPSLPAPSSEPPARSEENLEGAAAPALPGCRSAEAGGASRPQDSSPQRDGARRDVADSFDPSRLVGGTMRLTESDAVASLPAIWSGVWSTVCGKHVVAGPGKYAWQLKIEGARGGGPNLWYNMLVGVLPASSGDVVDTHFASKGGFGYFAEDGRKTNRTTVVEPYGPACGAGDVVTVVLDLTRRELSFEKNGRDLGVSHRVPAGEYRLAVSFSGERSVRILMSGPA